MSQPEAYYRGQKQTFTQDEYKGAGGEGTIYAKKGKAFKIYHDPAKCIPEGKIAELAQIQLPNVLGPQEVITDRHKRAIGFVMPFVSKTEYLCKLFTKGFCQTNGITTQDATALVLRMQKTLEAIHQKKILVVDYNEMNFLTNQEFTEVYYIDVDCYQTPHYPATAIMASIRDPQVQNQKWTEESDWFSFGILACQLYIKTHPYKARHPDFGKDWQAMMAAGVSIFNKASKMPPASLDLDQIPKGHRKWLEAVMEKGERSKPPLPEADNTPAAIPKATIIASTQTISVTPILKLDSGILALIPISGVRFVLTKTGLFEEEKKIQSFTPETGYQAKRTKRALAQIENIKDGSKRSPALLSFNPFKNSLVIKDTEGKLHEEIQTPGFFTIENRVYTTSEHGLVETTLMNMGQKPIAPKEIVAQVFHQHSIHQGMVLQDVLGHCTMTIPISEGKAQSYQIPALDKHRILSAKAEKGFAIVLSETQGKILRTRILFDKTFATFAFDQSEADEHEEVNFTVLDKGVCVYAHNDQIDVFANLQTTKTIENSQIENDHHLQSWQNQVFVTVNNQLLKISLS